MFAQNYIPTRLTGFVELISQQTSDRPYFWTFLPDGISCLMFRMHAESRFEIIQAENMGKFSNASNQFCFITGFSTRPVHVYFDHFDYIGAYLTPIALKALFGLSAADLKNFVIEGSLVLPDLALVEDKLNGLSGFEQKAKWLENWLYTKINETPELHTALAIRQLAKKMSIDQFNVKGKQLEACLGYSRAHTHRIFSEWFGLSSQKYQRLMKFVRSLETLHASVESLTEVGMSQGYFDQAHFIRTFREFSGLTPKAYRKLDTDFFAQYATS